MFVRQEDWSVAAALVMLAVAVGLVSVWRGGMGDMAAAARWLAWVGLGASPLLEWSQAPFAGVTWASCIFLLLIVTLALSTRYLARRMSLEVLSAIGGVLSLSALVMALLGY